jgi:xanthine dehydrogenase accessory factor
VGALGSRSNQAKRKDRLMTHFGLTEADFSRLHGPVGLAIGSKTPPEIALSVMAEIIAKKNSLPQQT